VNINSVNTQSPQIRMWVAPNVAGRTPMISTANLGGSTPLTIERSTQPSPAVISPMERYLAQPPALTDRISPLLQGLPYGSRPAESVGLIREGITSHFVAGIIPMPPGVIELAKSGIGNVFNPEWREAVQAAVAQNGGLGDSTNGFLAYSREHGFVRLLNPGLTPEQNRRLAEISLVMGAPIEKIPSRTKDSALDEPRISSWVDHFIGRFDKELSDFMADPTNGMSVREGRTRYKLEVKEQAGRVVSFSVKKAGGLKGLAQRAMKFIAPLADVVGIVANLVPGLGTAVAFGAQAIKTVGGMIATGGKFAASQIAGLAGSFLPWIGSKLGFGAMTATQAAVGRGALGIGAQLIDTGRVQPGRIASTLAPMVISGLPGGPNADLAASRLVGMVAQAIQDGKLDMTSLAPALYGILAPATGNGPADPRISATLELAAQYAAKGTLSAQELIQAIGPVLQSVTSKSNDMGSVSGTIRQVTEALASGSMTPAQLMDSPAAELLRQAVNRPAA